MDKQSHDNVKGDKIGNDKVMGDKIVQIFQGEKFEIPIEITNIPRVSREDFYGRIDELDYINKHFSNSDKALLIRGIGGIGKSSLANFFATKNKSNYSHIVWIDILNNIEKTPPITDLDIMRAFVFHPTLTKNLSLKLNKDSPIKDRFIQIMNRLQSLEGKHLMVVDNVTHEIEKLIELLPKYPSWQIIFTSRHSMTFFKELELGKLQKKEAENLFYNFYTLEKDEEKLNSILIFFDNHTLTIELLAKMANTMGFSLNKLIDRLEKEGLDILNAEKIKSKHDVSSEPQTPYEYLTRILKVANIGKTAIKYLQYFSILPSIYIKYEKLEKIFDAKNEDFFLSSLIELEKKGWLLLSNKSQVIEKREFRSHQVIQEVTRNQLKPELSNCYPVINYFGKMLSYILSTNPELLKEFLPYLESISKYIVVVKNKNFQVNDLAAVFANLSKYYEHIGDYHKSFEIYSKNLNLKLSLINKYKKEKDDIGIEIQEWELGVSFSNMASKYADLGKFQKAIELELNAIKLKNRPSKVIFKSPQTIATSYVNIGLYYFYIGDFQNALIYQRKGLDIDLMQIKAEMPGAELDLAFSLHNLALTYRSIGKIDEAINVLTQAILIREQLIPSHPELAKSYGNMADFFIGFENYIMAGIFAKKCLEIRQKVYPKNHPELYSVKQLCKYISQKIDKKEK